MRACGLFDLGESLQVLLLFALSSEHIHVDVVEFCDIINANTLFFLQLGACP